MVVENMLDDLFKTVTKRFMVKKGLMLTSSQPSNAHAASIPFC